MICKEKSRDVDRGSSAFLNFWVNRWINPQASPGPQP